MGLEVKLVFEEHFSLLAHHVVLSDIYIMENASLVVGLD